MSVLFDASPLTDAVLAAVTANLAGDTTAFEPGKIPGTNRVPGSLPGAYAVVHARRRPNGGPLISGHPTTTGWRVTIDAIGSTLWECQQVMARAAEALDGVTLRLDVDLDDPATTLAWESEEQPDWSKDSSRWLAFADFTCSI